MIFMLIAAGVIVVALCVHFSTKSYEPLVPDSYYTDYGPDWFEEMQEDEDELLTTPAFSNLAGNIYHDDC